MSKAAKRSDLKSLAVVLANITFVLAPIYLAANRGPSPMLVVYWLWFGLSMQGLLNLMHETAHLHVFRDRGANEFFGRWVLGALMFSDFDRYREIHWKHHRNIGNEGDPKYSYKIDVRGFQFVALVLRSLVLIEAVRKLRYVHGDAQPEVRGGAGRMWLIRTAALQGILIGSLFCVARGSVVHMLVSVISAYGFVYFYGILSLTILAANLRAVAEHQIWETQLEVAGVAALRNISSTPLSWVIFGCYGFAEHAAHHRAPAIPYYMLRAEIERSGMPIVSQGYFEILFSMITSREDSQSVRPARGLLMF